MVAEIKIAKSVGCPRRACARRQKSFKHVSLPFFSKKKRSLACIKYSTKDGVGDFSSFKVWMVWALNL